MSASKSSPSLVEFEIAERQRAIQQKIRYLDLTIQEQQQSLENSYKALDEQRTLLGEYTSILLKLETDRISGDKIRPDTWTTSTIPGQLVPST